MVYDSNIWKKELFKIAVSLKKCTQWKKIRMGQESNVEENVFLSAYIIRKLFEAKKLSFYLTNASISIITYKNNKHVDLMNWHRLDELYTLEKPENSTITIKNLLNVIIHSFVFFPCRYEMTAKLDGFFVSSDRIKDKHIIYVNIQNFIGLLEIIASDDKVVCCIKRNKKLDFEEYDPCTNRDHEKFEMSELLKNQNITEEEKEFFIKQRRELIDGRKANCSKYGIIAKTFL